MPTATLNRRPHSLATGAPASHRDRLAVDRPSLNRLAVESLESRLNLSAAAPLSAAPDSIDRALALGVTGHGSQVSTLAATARRVTSVGAFADPKAQSLPTLPASITTNAPAAPTAMWQYTSYYAQLYGPKPAPTPSPAPAPTPAVETTTFTTAPVTITTTNLVSFNQLTITGTSGNDSIHITQSGNILTLVANGQTTTYTATAFAQIAIHGNDGNDLITVNSSVALEALLYAGNGNDTLRGYGAGKTTLVAIGGGVDSLQGNSVNTSYWADNADSIAASSVEISAGRVHTVSAFYQPWSTSAANPDYISLDLAGQNLKDPASSYASTRLANRSLWGTGPTTNDIRQGSVGDCYFLSTLAAFAHKTPDQLRELAVDLGDGTYAVQFSRGNTKTFVRVDGDLPTYGGSSLAYAKPGAAGTLWAPILEKAYAFFRTAGQNSYASLNSGWMGSVMSDFGVANKSFYTSSDANAMYTTVSSALAAGKAFTIATNASVSGAPVVGSHAYTVISAHKDGSGNITFTLRNPWGFDGAGSDSNAADGLVTLTAAQLKSNFTYGTYAA